MSEESGSMHVVGMKIRGTHHYSFRSGEWAIVLGVFFVTPRGNLAPRPAFLAQYPDGKTDYISLEDRANYELAPIA